VHREQGRCQVYLQVHRLGGCSVRLQMHRKRWWEDQGRLMYAKQVPIWQPKKFRTRYRTTPFVYWSSSEPDQKWFPNVQNSLLNGIARDSHRMALWDSLDYYQKMITGLPRMEGAGTYYYWDWIRGLSGALYQRHRLGCLPNGLPNWMPNDYTGGSQACSVDAEGA